MEQVVGGFDFAGGVGGHRKRQVVGGDAAAIVADADEFGPAFLQRDLDPARPGVDGVLDEFLHDAGRSFDDLTGGDLVDEGGI